MRIGIVILPDQRWSVAGRRWQRAEEYGFDHAWTYDHLGWRDLIDGPWFDAVPTLTAAAMVTRRIRLGTYVATPNFRHPVHFAREVTTIDDISQGRLMIGLGAGGVGFDSAVLGQAELTAGRRVDRFAEFLGLFTDVLGDEPVTRHGDFYTAVNARSNPGTVQRPRPPFIVAANGRRALRLAARHGDGWVTTGVAGVASGPSFSVPDTAEQWWESVARLAASFDEALDETGRPRDEVARYLNLDTSPVYSLSSVEAFTDAVGRAAALGFTDVITHWPRERSWYAGDEKVLESVASRLPRLRSGTI
ncbi:luciferase [Paractinoplanes deccanensis]|uniref:Luciferase n=1 Tax=Paractinoplanes deccanensis TaxID=113561 RepID=A0ABQ3Y7C9_9ACTN|nr:LLM class flavin-dependent oxidoreductase [Actinoplanes deccanensis]GID75899.1 luciferase [Actinoplanes deccanensis]